jgi:cytidylate kinase
MELQQRGTPADLSTVTDEMQARDAADVARAAAPLRPANDAILLDTTLLNADEAFAKAIEIVKARCAA